MSIVELLTSFHIHSLIDFYQTTSFPALLDLFHIYVLPIPYLCFCIHTLIVYHKLPPFLPGSIHSISMSFPAVEVAPEKAPEKSPSPERVEIALQLKEEEKEVSQGQYQMQDFKKKRNIKNFS